MPRDGAITFDDLVGKLDMLHVACDKCGRKGRYAVARLIEQRGREAKVLDFLAEITGDCPKKQTGNMNDQCAARCPDLAKGCGFGTSGHCVAGRTSESLREFITVKI
jgi:hypothetical protein